MSPKPALRSTRATVFAAVCVTLATAGHSAASHAAVVPWAVGMGFAVVLVVAWVLTGAERSLATILGGLLGGQFMLHSLFMSAAAHPGGGGGGGAMMDSMHITAAGSGQGGATMTFAHVAAAVISAWWLRRGERAVWALARRAAALASWPVRALLALLDTAPLAAALGAPVSFRTCVARFRPGGRLLRHSVIRRGPPLCSTVLA
jgi:hypothetical protein